MTHHMLHVNGMVSAARNTPDIVLLQEMTYTFTRPCDICGKELQLYRDYMVWLPEQGVWLCGPLETSECLKAYMETPKPGRRKRTTLLDNLRALHGDTDEESAHRRADILLLEHIDDPEVTEAFDEIHRLRVQQTATLYRERPE